MYIIEYFDYPLHIFVSIDGIWDRDRGHAKKYTLSEANEAKEALVEV